jgi:hypothetical protein
MPLQHALNHSYQGKTCSCPWQGPTTSPKMKTRIPPPSNAPPDHKASCKRQFYHASHIQPNVQNLPFLHITMQVPHEMALQNGQLGDRAQQRATRKSPLDSKPQNRGSVGTLVWKQTQPTSTGHARTKHRYDYNRLHPLQLSTM